MSQEAREERPAAVLEDSVRASRVCFNEDEQLEAVNNCWRTSFGRLKSKYKSWSIAKDGEGGRGAQAGGDGDRGEKCTNGRGEEVVADDVVLMDEEGQFFAMPGLLPQCVLDGDDMASDASQTLIIGGPRE